MKQAAAAELRICARKNGRPHLAVTCQLYARSQEHWIQLMCACGLVCILRSGGAVTGPLLSLTLCPVTIEDAMSALRTASLQALCLPLPRSMVRRDIARIFEREDYEVNLQAYVYDALSELRGLPTYDTVEEDAQHSRWEHNSTLLNPPSGTEQ